VEHVFGVERPFAVGVEEELLLVHPETLALDHVASELLARLQWLGAAVKPDVYEAMVEIASPVSRDAPAAIASLRGLRQALRSAGATAIGAGLHPDAELFDVVHVPQPRYRTIAESMRGLLRRTPTSALHVHVGMPDPRTAITVFNGLREHLPLLQALAANSPFWYGADSGFATARAQVFRGFPSAAVPRAFASWEDYVTTVETAVAAGGLPDYTYLWWDLRPHPRLGTVELRAMDAQARLATTLGLAALTHALAAACAEAGPAAPSSPEALTESSFRAARDGLDATIWSDGAMRPLREVAAAALALARPYARDLAGEAALEEVERILREGNGADRARSAYARGGMRAVLEQLVDEAAEGSYGYTQTTVPIDIQS
jgi:glutamate---cysteine ligase / carboxylate-amine ligase